MREIERITAFLHQIGIGLRQESIDAPTFLPGLRVEGGTIVYDLARLAHPGDLLHEAGHIAFTPAAQRPLLCDTFTFDPGDEMAAIAWSYAALVHLQLDPAVVFHAGGYRGGARACIENFAAGRYVGVPMLQWADMAGDDFPRMAKWLRD